MCKLCRVFVCLGLMVCLVQSCFRIQSSEGGGQLDYQPEERRLDPADVLLPEGYTIEVVARGLTFPTGAVEDGEGRLYVTESGYAYGEVFLPPKLLRIEDDGSTSLIVEGKRNGPWTGVTYHDESFYLSEGGQLEGGKILRIEHDGTVNILVENLPSLGDHHTNIPVVKDGFVYFGQGNRDQFCSSGKGQCRFWVAFKKT